MAGSALKRLMAEHRQLMKNPPEGIVAGPRGDENYFEWEAHILGPPDTCFEYGVFKGRVPRLFLNISQSFSSRLEHLD